MLLDLVVMHHSTQLYTLSTKYSQGGLCQKLVDLILEKEGMTEIKHLTPGQPLVVNQHQRIERVNRATLDPVTDVTLKSWVYLLIRCKDKYQ
jgi:hypothetical protein